MSTVPKQISALKMAQQWFNQHRLPERPEDVTAEQVKKAIEIALAEQKSIEMIRNIDIDWQEPYITAAQARELGAGNAEYRSNKFWVWQTCGENFIYWDTSLQYRAIKQAQPEPVEQWQENDNSRGFDKLAEKQSPELLIPVDPHATLRAEYIRQRDAVPCELGFYLWECNLNAGKTIPAIWCLAPPLFREGSEYRCTDISCYVSKDGESAIRMLRTEAQELQAKTRDECDWFTPFSSQLDVDDDFFSFGSKGTYTYRTKATIKLDGRRVTPEQAAAEWDAKKETHVMWFKFANIDWTDVIVYPEDYVEYFANTANCEYELRPKQPTWTGSREDVIALLKEVGVL